MIMAHFFHAKSVQFVYTAAFIVSWPDWLDNAGSMLAGTFSDAMLATPKPGWVAEWSCSGLQLRSRRFDSDPSLHFQLNKRNSTKLTPD